MSSHYWHIKLHQKRKLTYSQDLERRQQMVCVRKKCYLASRNYYQYHTDHDDFRSDADHIHIHTAHWWFILTMIIITSGSLASSVVTDVQKHGLLKSRRIVCLLDEIHRIYLFEGIPEHLMSIRCKNLFQDC
ncbi:Acetylcholine receptor [Dirofilaria immitis]